MDRQAASPELECVLEPRRAAALLHPLRLHLLRLARDPASAADLAGRLRLPRQRVNYHVRELFRAGFLRKAGRRRKRNMVEQRYVAGARAYLLAPELLGALGARREQVQDTASAAYLLALCAQAQSELGRALRESTRQGKRLATLSLAADVRFRTREERSAFTRALQQCVADVVAQHSAPEHRADGRPGLGRAFRLVVGCYPIPAETRAGARKEER